MLKYSSKETHPQKISWTCRPLLCSDAPARLLSLPVSVFHGPQSVMPTLSLISSHIFSLSFYFVLSASRHKHWPWPSRHTVAVLSNCVPFLSLSTHLSLAWMKSLSFWNSVKPQMENCFILPAVPLVDWVQLWGGREGGGLKEKEEGGRTTAPNWHEAERQWKPPMASLTFEFMSALLPLIGHSSIVLRRLSQSVSPNQTAAPGSGVRMAFYGHHYGFHHVLLLATSASMKKQTLS